jgi:hypothetical protein
MTMAVSADHRSAISPGLVPPGPLFVAWSGRDTNNKGSAYCPATMTRARRCSQGRNTSSNLVGSANPGSPRGGDTELLATSAGTFALWRTHAQQHLRQPIQASPVQSRPFNGGIGPHHQFRK